MVDMSQFKMPVHRSLLPRELIAGVPQAGVLILFFLGLIFVYGLRLYWSLVPIALIYLLMRYLTKQDQWLIDILLDNIMQKDIYIP